MDREVRTCRQQGHAPRGLPRGGTMMTGGDGPWSGTTRGDRAFALLAGAIWLALLCIGSFA